MISLLEIKIRESKNSDTIYELFKSTGGKIASIGSAVAAAVAATWAIKNPEEVSNAIDTILSKVKGDNEKVVAYVKQLFGMKDPEAATAALKKTANMSNNQIIDVLGSGDTSQDKPISQTKAFNDFIKNLKKFGSKWLHSASPNDVKNIMNKDFG